MNPLPSRVLSGRTCDKIFTPCVFILRSAKPVVKISKDVCGEEEREWNVIAGRRGKQPGQAPPSYSGSSSRETGPVRWFCCEVITALRRQTAATEGQVVTENYILNLGYV